MEIYEIKRIFQTIHPYERKLLTCISTSELPLPPPEYLRLLRDRAELKAQCLLFQVSVFMKVNIP